jgi:hypothetical protein
MTVNQIYRRRYCTPDGGEYGFAFVRWTLNAIAGVVAMLIVSSAILVTILISDTIDRWV